MSDVHDKWEELAAGHALDALEPEESEAFIAHLAGCTRCQDVLADHTFVAAQLGTIVDDEDEAPSWDRIRRGVIAPEPQVASLDAARSLRRAPRLLVAAASLALVASAAAATVLLTRDGTPNDQQQVLAACSSEAGCHVVHLQGKADVVVANGAARVLSVSLPPAPTGRVYVLWQLPHAGRPAMVSTLRVTGPGSVGEEHPLAVPYGSTAAFGLSLERASVVPEGPTDVVALGET